MRIQRDAPAGTEAVVGVLGIPGMWALLATSTLGFAGYSLLLPTAPLWAARGGAGEAGAGLVNAVLMLTTVLAQTTVPWLLRRVGWRVTLVGGALLLGLPALAFVVSPALPWMLAWSAVRGAGFAVLTVCGASAVAELVEPARRGRAIGIYGLSIALPQVVLLPAAGWIADTVDFRVVFVAAVAPALAVPFAAALGARLDRSGPPPADAEPPVRRTRVLLALTMPALVLLAITTPGGALLTFAPQFPYPPAATTLGLLGLTVAAAVARWLVGGLADRHGPLPFLPPLLAVGAVGLAMTAWAIGTGASASILVIGMTVVGIAYGSVQNLTLVAAFAAVPAADRGTASAVWNIGFDAGTGLGALVVGYIAAGAGFAIGLAVPAAVLVVAALFVLQACLRARSKA